MNRETICEYMLTITRPLRHAGMKYQKGKREVEKLQRTYKEEESTGFDSKKREDPDRYHTSSFNDLMLESGTLHKMESAEGGTLLFQIC